MSLHSLHSAADVAAALDQTEHYVKQKCRRREWPHVRVARGEVRFTDEHYTEILRLCEAPVATAPVTGLSFAPRSRRAS